MSEASISRGKWYRSLRFRAVILLTLALLPIGIIAILQTRSVAESAARSSQAAVLALTERAAISERLIIEKATGAAKLLVAMEPTFRNDPEQCKMRLADFVKANPRFSFAGIIPLSGMMTCSSTGNTFDFSKMEGFETSMANQSATVTMNKKGALSQQSVIIISEPFFENGEFAGYISLSVPHNRLLVDPSEGAPLGLQDIVTFNSRGDVLTSKHSLDSVGDTLPKSVELTELIQQQDTVFLATNRLGQGRVYAIVPIRDETLYVLGIWEPTIAHPMKAQAWISPGLFPILMWIVSLAVASLAIHHLVTRHVHHLRDKLTIFAKDRSFQPGPDGRRMSTEFLDINEAFNDMAAAIIRNEGALEAAVQERNILIKDIHHRVKNNLQLISSIINMQIRDTQDTKAVAGLRAVQDRVFNMAVIRHDHLSEDLSTGVITQDLASDIVRKNNAVSAALDDGTLTLHMDVEDIDLNADQAITFSLLLAELAAKAAQSIAPEGGTMSVSHEIEESGISILRISTTHSQDNQTAASQNLGKQLIKAFVIQLGATLTSKIDGDLKTTTLTFKPSDQVNRVLDY